MLAQHSRRSPDRMRIGRAEILQVQTANKGCETPRPTPTFQKPLSKKPHHKPRPPVPHKHHTNGFTITRAPSAHQLRSIHYLLKVEYEQRRWILIGILSRPKKCSSSYRLPSKCKKYPSYEAILKVCSRLSPQLTGNYSQAKPSRVTIGSHCGSR